MASPQNFVFAVYDPITSAPKTGLAGSMSWDACCDENGTAITPPTITEIGGGLYTFLPVWTPGHGFAFTIATGNNPARVHGYLRPEDYGGYTSAPSPKIVVFPIFVFSGGIPKTGATPTFSKYSDENGTAITPPTITEIGFGLYKFTPTFTPNHDACYVISTGGTNWPANVSGFLRVEDYAFNAPATLPTTAAAVTPSNNTSILGTDTFCDTDLRQVSVPVSGQQMVGLRIFHRLSTPRGGLAAIGDDPAFGWDLRQLVNAKLGPTQITLYSAQIQAECLKDEAVAACTCTITFVAATGAVNVSLLLTTADGPFTLVLGVNNLTVALLDTF